MTTKLIPLGAIIAQNHGPDGGLDARGVAMIGSVAHPARTGQRLALKDDMLVYRACTLAFASTYELPSPERIIGSTDFALLPRAEAREQLVLDSRVMHTGRAGIGIIHPRAGGRPMLIVREPVFSHGNRVKGIDIRLIADADDPEDVESLLALVGAGATVPEALSLAGIMQPHTAMPNSLLQSRLQGLRFRHFAEASADFFWELDADLRFSYVSPGFSTVFEKLRAQVIGQRHDLLVRDARRADSECHWNQHQTSIVAQRPFRDFEFRWAGDNGIKSIRYSGMPIFNRAGAFLGYRGTGSDVTAIVKQAETTAYHASHDTLTGLYNRRHFEQKVKEAWAATKTSHVTHAVCFMDMDNFKIVNDTCGHQAGDELLRQLAQLFIGLVRQSDILARIGGDEFGLMLHDCSMAEALKLANQVRHEVENFQFLWRDYRFTVGVSIGMVVLDDRWESVPVLFRAADSACYLAKNGGRNRVVVHREAEGHSNNRQAATQWVEEIGTALANDRLVLARQEVLSLKPDTVEPGGRFEMLLRLRLPSDELVNPSAFLPSAERYGLSAALDERALDLTLAWLDANPDVRDDTVSCSLNLASGSFADGDFAHRLVAKIEASGIDPGKFCFDFTETATIANLSSAVSFMQIISAIGCHFCIDSFGAGLSSFSYLRKLPVSCLKIDGLLVKGILEDTTQHTLLRAISDISHSMGKQTVAGSVDSPELLAEVRSMGIDFAQGYHIGKPELVRLPT